MEKMDENILYTNNEVIPINMFISKFSKVKLETIIKIHKIYKNKDNYKDEYNINDILYEYMNS